MLSPASLYVLTVVAWTRSWSQMAALWRSVHRRTGETTVRISMATQQSRNWVRKRHVCYSCVPVCLSVCLSFCVHRAWYCSHSQHKAYSQFIWGARGILGSALHCLLVLGVGHIVVWGPANFLTAQNRFLILSSPGGSGGILCDFTCPTPLRLVAAAATPTPGSAAVDVTTSPFLYPRFFFVAVHDLEMVPSQTPV